MHLLQLYVASPTAAEWTWLARGPDQQHLLLTTVQSAYMQVWIHWNILTEKLNCRLKRVISF